MESKIKSFKDLEIWRLSHQAVLIIYDLIKNIPRREDYNVKSQLMRASVSIPTNIAEGMGRYSRKEFIQFLNISRGSVEECKYLLILCSDLKYITNDDFEKITSLYDIIGKKINSLINSIKSKIK
jgi:four helix bundle protein